MIQKVFRRYEIKYLITLEQKKIILETMNQYMTLDQYGHSVIRNLYYDTDSYRLIRHSLEKTIYKEKLRIRSYQQCEEDSCVFVELKKKYDSIVYKRRITMNYRDALNWLAGKTKNFDHQQIVKEVDYFLSYYKTLHPVVFLSYEREAYSSNNGEDFRVTFDNNILFRTDELTLDSKVFGTTLISDNQVLMEIKCTGGIPLWMTQILTNQKIFKTSFSKYGKAYELIKKQEEQKNGTDLQRII